MTDAFDIHSHYMPADLPDFATEFGDARWPWLVVTVGATAARAGG